MNRFAVTLGMLGLLAGCGGNKTEAPAAAAPALAGATAEPAAAPVETAAAKPEAAQAGTSPAPGTAPLQPAPAVKPSPNDPPFTPGTSLPGAIPPSPMPDTKPDKPADPLKQLQDEQNRHADYQKRVSEAEANLAVAQASVGNWQNTILAFKNPFRPRPQLSPEDQQAIEGKDGVARVSWAEGKLAAATAARDAAQKTLDDLKANPQ